MKNLKLLTLFLVPCLFIMSSCGSISFKKEGGGKTVKMVFEKKDYKDNPPVFYSIKSTKSNGARNIIESTTRLKAQNDLSSKIKTYIKSEISLNEEMSNGKSSESSRSVVSGKVAKAMENLIEVDSEWISYGGDVYEFWGVYKVEVK